MRVQTTTSTRNLKCLQGGGQRLLPSAFLCPALSAPNHFPVPSISNPRYYNSLTPTLLQTHTAAHEHFKNIQALKLFCLCLVWKCRSAYTCWHFFKIVLDWSNFSLLACRVTRAVSRPLWRKKGASVRLCIVQKHTFTMDTWLDCINCNRGSKLRAVLIWQRHNDLIFKLFPFLSNHLKMITCFLAAWPCSCARRRHVQTMQTLQSLVWQLSSLCWITSYIRDKLELFKTFFYV